MNDKTAKLINRYAGRSNEDKNTLKRRWLAMSKDERAHFRREMLETLGDDESADTDESSETDD